MPKKHDDDEVVDLQEDEAVEVVEEDESEEPVQASEESNDSHEDEAPSRNETEEQAEARRIRNAQRRLERKEARKSRIQEDKARIQAQERQIRELTERLLKVENSQQANAVSRMEASIENQEALIAKIKQAIASTEDRIEHSDLIDRLADEKLKLRDLKSQKDMALKEAKSPPKQNIATQRQLEQDRLTRNWMSKNSWYDPQGKGFDSRIALAVDQAMVEEGMWDASDPSYWKEFDRRLAKQLPHRYSRDEDDEPYQSLPPNASGRNERVGKTAKPGQYVISKARKEAMIEAGIWDDPVARERQIKAYMKFDKEQGAL